jgi:glycosyltransferase involved in cell wall biosynthesis
MIPRLSVVIPTFNEAARIESTLATLTGGLPPAAEPWEIVVADDGSADATCTIVTDAAARDARIRLLREPHRGKGGAVRAGMLAARGALRFMCDADLSMPVTELVRFLPHVPSHADIAIGTREGTGARRVGEPSYRHLMGRVFNGIVRLAGLSGIDDTQCGFKLFTAEAAQATFSRLTIDGWAFDIEALVIARRRGLRVREVPIEWHYRELSRVRPVVDALRMTRDVLRIRMNALRGLYE